jgi:O-succinylbenzoic acid--CoA ligase
VNRGEAGAGTPLDGVEIRFVDGRIQVRSPTLLTAYHTESGSFCPIDGAGWFDTNDHGHLDDHGNLHVVGRADDLIVSGGEKVAPLEVERVLEAFPGVRSACVFGVKDDVWGARVAAAVCPMGASLSLPQLSTYAAARLAPFERPRLFAMLDAMPVSEGGKLDRRAAAALATPLLAPLP